MNFAVARRSPKNFNRVSEVRALVPGDLEYIRQRSARVPIRQLRESHHNIARLLAAGLTNREAAARLNYTEQRISILRNDPSVKELIATYRAEVHESWREHVDALNADAVRAMATGMRNVADKMEALDEDPDAIPLPIVAKITSDLMDRFGYGKHQTNVNVNVDFAKRLEQAITRSSRTLVDP